MVVRLYSLEVSIHQIYRGDDTQREGPAELVSRSAEQIDPIDCDRVLDGRSFERMCSILVSEHRSESQKSESELEYGHARIAG